MQGRSRLDTPFKDSGQDSKVDSSARQSLEADSDCTTGVPSGLADTRTQYPHLSDAAMLTTAVGDPLPHQHFDEEGKKWIEYDLSESATSSTKQTSGSTDKNEVIIEEKLETHDLERTQSKTSQASMLADFPDGGKWAWFSICFAPR